jgi:hypothetical protein
MTELKKKRAWRKGKKPQLNPGKPSKLGLTFKIHNP